MGLSLVFRLYSKENYPLKGNIDVLELVKGSSHSFGPVFYEHSKIPGTIQLVLLLLH